MSSPIVRRLQDLTWQGWPEDQVVERGRIMWKTLLDDAPQGANMVMGVARLRKGESLEPHRHAEPESYFGLRGRGAGLALLRERIGAVEEQCGADECDGQGLEQGTAHARTLRADEIT